MLCFSGMFLPKWSVLDACNKGSVYYMQPLIYVLQHSLLLLLFLFIIIVIIMCN